MEWFLKCASLGHKSMSQEDKWVWECEPHSPRRQEILKKHPEIKKLMGYDPTIAFIVTGEVLIQIAMAWVLRDSSWWTISLIAYCFGGVFNHSLGSAIHEIGHNLAFGHSRPWANRLLSILANLPLVAPMAVSYKKYHADHHRFLGEEMQDVDIPTRLESYLFRHPITKIIWLIIHPIIHALRPFYKSPKPVLGWEIVNFVCQLIFNIAILQLFGIKSLVYLFLGTFMSLGFHPLAGHFISEHYLFNGGQATHSYYGPLNFILFNVGYHIEHHDFPYIPYRKLPEVKKLAPEYYDHFPYHTSWVKVLWDFIFDYNLGPHARGVGYLKDMEVPKGVSANGNAHNSAIRRQNGDITPNGVTKENGIHHIKST